MSFCNYSHAEIYYETEKCPACEVFKQLEPLRLEIRRLNLALDVHEGMHTIIKNFSKKTLND